MSALPGSPVRWVLLAGALLAGATLAAAPAGRYVLTTDTVFDTQTNLTWVRGGSFFGTQAAAMAHCGALSLGGLTGWRLPTVKELMSLVDFRAQYPAIDTTAFPGTSGGAYWTSTSLVGPPAAWIITFDFGYLMPQGPSSPALARCVR